MHTPTITTDSTPEHIAATIENSFAAFTRHKATILHTIALFDALNLARHFGASTTAQWLIRTLALPNSTAHEYVKIARAMKRFTTLATAFFDGTTNYSKIRLILPFLTDDNETELVDLACTLGYHELELALLRYRTRPPTPTRKTYVRLKTQPDGRLRLWADFNPAEAARLTAALKVGELAWHDVDWHTLVGNDGYLDTSHITTELNHHTPRHCSGFGPPISQHLVSAFMGMVNIALTQPNNPLRAPGAHVNIVMTTDGKAYLPTNPGAPSDAVKNFLANAHYRINTVDDTGLVLNTGRRFRLATNAQVNALMLMWRGQCAMPGCTHTRFIEMHHIHDWADGGPTDLDNLIPLCSACHTLTSDGAVKILRDHEDTHFLYPGGIRYVSHNYGLPTRNDNARTLTEYNDITWA